MKNLYLIPILLATLLSLDGSAQESSPPRKIIKYSGGINVNTVFSSGIYTQNPFNYFLSGNLNFRVLDDLVIPVNLNYSNRKISLSQGYSFNQISINPSYKWATAHIGTNYMTFSPYTLNGHQFLGVGFDLKPENWDIQLMSGRLLKGQNQDTTNTTGPTFSRYAYGAKVLYAPGNYSFGFSFLNSNDRGSSLAEENRFFDNRVLNPESNLVVGLNFNAVLLHDFQLNVEFSNSIVTSKNDNLNESLRIKSLAGLFKKGDASTQSHNAFKTQLSYNLNQGTGILGVGFEQVDPNYRTHGAYYFVEDIRNYTLNYSQSFSENKFNLASNIGIQQDDIKKTKATQSKRFVGSLNINAQPNEGLAMGLNFSNFQSYQFVNDIYSQITRVPGQPIDSLDYSMISQNLGYNLSKKVKESETKTETFLMNLNFLNSTSKSDKVTIDERGNKIFNGTTNYQFDYLKKHTKLVLGLNFLTNNIGLNKLTGFGPIVQVQKELANNKFRTSLSMSVLSTKMESPDDLLQKNSVVSNIQVNANYVPKEKHNLFFNAGLVQNNNAKGYFNSTVGYNYTF
jgi:hypothetical protein